MKLAIATVAFNLPQWSQITIKRLHEYANRVGAGLHVISPSEFPSLLARGPLFREIIEQYDRTLVIDCDLVVSREAPNIFDHEPGNAWMVSDSPANDPHAVCRFNEMVIAQSVFGPLGWTQNYGNCGVCLIDKEHALAWRGWKVIPGTIHEQLNINYLLRALTPKPHAHFRKLDPKWNKMGINSGVPNAVSCCPVIAEGAYIAHAAGFRPEDRQAAIECFDRILP